MLCNPHWVRIAQSYVFSYMKKTAAHLYKASVFFSRWRMPGTTGKGLEGIYYKYKCGYAVF